MKTTPPPPIIIDSGNGPQVARAFTADPKATIIDAKTGERATLEEFHRREGYPPNVAENEWAKRLRSVRDQIGAALGSTTQLLSGGRDGIMAKLSQVCDLTDPKGETARKFGLGSMVILLPALSVAHEALKYVTSIGQDKPEGAPWFMKLLKIFSGIVACRGGVAALTSNPKKLGFDTPKTAIMAMLVWLATTFGVDAFTPGTMFRHLLELMGFSKDVDAYARM